MFAKVYTQIFDSSIARDPELRHMFEDMLKLCDRDGVVDMTYEAIAARTRQPIELVISKIAELMKPDPESRSKKEHGARLTLIDDRRAWGWKIVNYTDYRNMRDQDSRREYRRNWMRKHRAMNAVNSVNSRELCEQNGAHRGAKGREGARREQACSRVNSESDFTQLNREHSVNTSEQALTPVNTREPMQRQIQIVPPAVPQGGQQIAAYVDTFDEAKKLICKLILNGKDPNRPWRVETMKALLKQLPIPRLEIERVAWFRNLPDDPKMPELMARKSITENGICVFWSDEVDRANAFWKKINGVEEEKKEPPRWREFFVWKNDERVALPSSFYQLDGYLQREYERDFTTFEQAQK